MDFYRRNPFFYSLLFVLILVGLSGGWYLAQQDGELRELKRAYATKSAQYERYLAARPSPTRSNLEALEQNYAELYEEFERTMRVLNLNTFDKKQFFGRTPVSRADWSFTLHKYKENARYAALRNSIELPPNAQFGFESFAEVMPTAENSESIHQQIVIMSSLLQTLFDSGIQSFVKIQRGYQSGAGASSRIANRSGDRLYNDGDEFIANPEMSAAVPGVIDAYSFRVAFRGQSIALRSFLNSVVNSSLPYVIRSVEVDLSSEGGAKLGLENIADNPFARSSPNNIASQVSSVPIISDNTSLFVVTIEFLDLVAEIVPPAAPVEEEVTDA